MSKIIKNRLLLGTLIWIFLYVLVSIYYPPILVSAASAVAVVITGVVMAFRYTPDTYRILFYQKRIEGDNSHLAVYGACIVAYGLIVIGGYALAFFSQGMPDSWSGTAISGVGRAICASGLWLLWRSPSPKPPDDSFTGNFLNMSMVVIICIVSFLAGMHFTVSP